MIRKIEGAGCTSGLATDRTPSRGAALVWFSNLPVACAKAQGRLLTSV